MRCDAISLAECKACGTVLSELWVVILTTTSMQQQFRKDRVPLLAAATLASQPLITGQLHAVGNYCLTSTRALVDFQSSGRTAPIAVRVR